MPRFELQFPCVLGLIATARLLFGLTWRWSVIGAALCAALAPLLHLSIVLFCRNSTNAASTSTNSLVNGSCRSLRYLRSCWNYCVLRIMLVAVHLRSKLSTCCVGASAPNDRTTSESGSGLGCRDALAESLRRREQALPLPTSASSARSGAASFGDSEDLDRPVHLATYWKVCGHSPRGSTLPSKRYGTRPTAHEQRAATKGMGAGTTSSTPPISSRRASLTSMGTAVRPTTGRTRRGFPSPTSPTDTASGNVTGSPLRNDSN